MESTEAEEVPVKRGRGRPKGTTYETTSKKPKVPGRGRGRPPGSKKTPKPKVPGRGRGRPKGTTKAAKAQT